MAFQTTVHAAPPHRHATPLLAVLVMRGQLPASLGALDTALDGALTRLYASGDFVGKKGEMALLHPDGPARRVLLVGLGDAKTASATRVRESSAAAARRARATGARTATLFLTEEVFAHVPAKRAGQAMAEGAAFGAWDFTELRQQGEDDRPPLGRVEILAPRKTKTIEAGHRLGAAIGAGQSFARNLQMLPGNVCTPKYLARVAKDLAARHKFKISVLDRRAIEKEGLTALMAVAQGSAEEPRFMALEYRRAGARKPVVLIGKGVTFDTGGISIKPAASMEEMKFDMSGAAAVLGVFEMLGRLKPKANVVGLIPATENMPSGTAIKPGDVVRAHLGKTIEIVNTDAEGRLILCDALSYARRFEPACAIDIATLTGAVVVALGDVAMAVMGSDDGLVEALRSSGERTGERAWPLPMFDEYRDLIKSQIADVKNSGGRAAGTITAGWFLREFVDGFPWAHLDIAGTAYSDRETPTRVKGPTGSSVRLLSDFILSRRS